MRKRRANGPYKKPEDRRSARVYAPLTPEQEAALLRAADDADLPKGTLLRQIAAEWLAAHGYLPPHS